MGNKAVEFFNEEMAEHYDERNSKLSPIKDALLFTLSLVLKDIPNDSKVLCVGAGTGSEIITFSKWFPNWSFVALEPSKSMLDVCEKRLSEEGISDKCKFINGYVEDLPNKEKYDAVISLFVGHFIPKNQRIDYFKGMTDRLKKNRYLINVEISFDLNSSAFPLMLDKWGEVQKLMGATQESLENLPKQLKEVLKVLPPLKVEEEIIEGGIETPVSFFQSLMISGWFGKK